MIIICSRVRQAPLVAFSRFAVCDLNLRFSGLGNSPNAIGCCDPGKSCKFGSEVWMFLEFDSGGLSILVAEDLDGDVEILKRAFSKAGGDARLHFVRDGQEAIEYLRRDPNTHVLPAMLLLDLKMPRVSGFEVLEWLRKHPGLHRLVVVIFTSSDVPEDINRAYDLGANSYLVKPVEFVGLVETAKHLRDYWLKLNRRGQPAGGKRGKGEQEE